MYFINCYAIFVSALRATSQLFVFFNSVCKQNVDVRVLSCWGSCLDPNLPITLATEASSFRLSGVLSHIMPNGTERTIAFASRSLTAAEKNYSQLDRKATAVVWACKKFYDSFFGKQFILILVAKTFAPYYIHIKVYQLCPHQECFDMCNFFQALII